MTNYCLRVAEGVCTFSSHVLVPFATAFVLAAGLSASRRRTLLERRDDHPSLPPGQGREVMIARLFAVHEPEMVADQQFDQAEWKSLVDRWQGKVPPPPRRSSTRSCVTWPSRLPAAK